MSVNNWIMPLYIDLPSHLPMLQQKPFCVTRIVFHVIDSNNVGIPMVDTEREIRPDKAYVFDDLCVTESAYREPISAAIQVPRYGGSLGSYWDEMLNKSIDPSYYYPFDYRKLDVVTWVEISYEDSGGKTVLMNITPKVVGYISISNWDTNVQISQESSPELGHDFARVNVIFQRPLAYRALTVVLLLSLFIFIFLLVFVDSISSLLEVALGILLGLWGVQDILVPKDITWPTIIDPLILTLYVFLAFIVFVSVLGKKIWGLFGNPPVPIETEAKTNSYSPE